MEAGLVGLPYSGKTTLFSALTGLAPDPAAGALKPNVGVAPIPDPRLDAIAEHIKTQKIVPATLQLVDIAGLVRGSSTGEGLGNKFLGHIQKVDALIHVVRCFEKSPGGAQVAHVEGSLNAARDIDTIETELVLSDLQTIESALPKAEKSARSRDPSAAARVSIMKKLAPVLEDGAAARTVAIDDPEEKKALRSLGLLSAKPVLYVANVDDDDLAGEGEHAAAVRRIAEQQGMQSVAVCAKLEAELAEMDEADRTEMLASLGLERPALVTLAHAAYRLLGLQSFYTAGPKEVRAWTIPIGAKAPQAAGAIHSDLERGFIRAEVYKVGDLVELKSEKAIKDAGRMRIEGKNYVMQDGDVCHILFNV